MMSISTLLVVVRRARIARIAAWLLDTQECMHQLNHALLY